MKRIFKLAAVCMLLCGLTLPFSVCAKEADAQVEPRMTSILACSTELTISSDGVASIFGTVRGTIGVTNTYVEVTLQKNVSGRWVDVDSWENSTDTRNTIVAETYEVSRGTYRVTMTCSADGETKTATSAERTY